MPPPKALALGGPGVRDEEAQGKADEVRGNVGEGRADSAEQIATTTAAPPDTSPVQHQGAVDLLYYPPLQLRDEALALIVRGLRRTTSTVMSSRAPWMMTPMISPSTSTASPRLRPGVSRTHRSVGVRLLHHQQAKNLLVSRSPQKLGFFQGHVSRLLSRTLVKLRKGLTLEE
ncbi:hypothetical protein GCM10012286_43440 [Streptomyces lasiicapitis]|uniref:Uncharacterized protein n=1 Tax=Streptomyces lasiicapitis TaxID=1923961 RepID=A0ABQ2M8L8_9ACTN|nr:hypothetical protein GCM10012286_43440 [Streptomyces lasiicapitis]